MTELVRKAIEQIHRALSLIHGSNFEAALLSLGPDLLIQFSKGSKKHYFVVEVKAHLWPAEVKWTAQKLLDYCRQAHDGGYVPIVVAPSISERVAEECDKAGLFWADLAGNCHIQFADVLIHIEGRPSAVKEKRGTASLYSSRSSRVIHALLLEPQRSWKVTDLSERTHVSLGQVSNVRQLLIQNAFAESSAEGLKIVEPERLLSDWAANYKPRRAAKRFFTLKRSDEFVLLLNAKLPECAVTEMAAAEMYAPYTRYQHVSFYFDDWNSSVVKELDLRPADGAANVTAYESSDGLLFAEMRESVRCSSPIVTYLDLVLLGGRGQDAAEHLLKTTIQPRWK